ncbi:hypothetical protein RN001_006222 [Aquatica leii]|uniref:Single domain-containing protein n=1 Tax=Aquatica leii TaxID=1421715 RepID=A0AAN7QKV3_9COLE|nr:hypothetical protein RN001_006222 [Aquatica leii]
MQKIELSYDSFIEIQASIDAFDTVDQSNEIINFENDYFNLISNAERIIIEHESHQATNTLSTRSIVSEEAITPNEKKRSVASNRLLTSAIATTHLATLCNERLEFVKLEFGYEKAYHGTLVSIAPCALFKGLLLCAFVYGSEKATRIPGHCVYHGKVFPESGDFVPAPIGFCLKLKCVKAEGNTISMLTCPMMQLPAGAHWSAKDLTKEYPHCCPKALYN